MDTLMKHYIYISDTKVDMLYEQINESLLNKFAGELSIDLKPGGVGIGGTIKPNPVKETRISKLRLVVKSLEEKKSVGWIDAPRNYFKGSLNMQWGLVYGRGGSETPSAVQFSGRTERTAFGMIGSLHHMIGNIGNASDSQKHWHTPHEILKTLASTIEQPKSFDDKSLKLVIREWLNNVSVEDLKQQRSLEFLAVNYLFSKGEGLDLLLGSPNLRCLCGLKMQPIITHMSV